MNYDYILHDNDIDYGIVIGNNKIVFIKSGLGGNCLGYENKYLKIALRLKERYGCSVIVASNPNNGTKHTEIDKQIIEDYILEHHICSPKLFFFGHSNGGIKGLEMINEGVEFKKMVLVNMPLMINFHKTKQYIALATQTEIVAIYGQHDPSFSYVPFLDGKSHNIKVVTVPNADHHFKGMLNDFINLSDILISETYS